MVLVFFFVPLSGISESDEGDFQYYYAGNLSVLSMILQKKGQKKTPTTYAKTVFLSFCIVNLLF